MFKRPETPNASSGPVSGAPPKAESPERRNEVRYPFSGSAEVYEFRSKILVKGRCSDLSKGGCYVDTLSPFPVGALVRIRMERESRKFEASAVVAYANAPMGMGLAFTELNDEHKGVLRSWIAELSGEPFSEPEAPPVQKEPEQAAEDAGSNLRLVVSELVTLLVRKKVITEKEASSLLREIFR